MITALLVPLSFLVILVQSQTVGTQSLTQPTIPGCPVHVNGCSIPCDFPFVYKTKFINACNKHDVCYSCVSVVSLSISNTDCNSTCLEIIQCFPYVWRTCNWGKFMIYLEVGGSMWILRKTRSRLL